uniref:Cytochrome c oxidase subunit 7A2, mitochondrial n=1 Tax=Esox lucius TaxID=8010 RepID=A0AAY5KXE6_ESOLU
MYKQIYLCLQQLSRRTICSTARRQVDNMVKEKQKLFQADNGIPVHLKGGAMDAILYRLTMGLTVFGTGFVVYELLSASMPKKS